MKAEVECLTCIYNQILRISKTATSNQEKLELIMKLSAKLLYSANLNQTPPEVAQPSYELAFKILENWDPYKEIKYEHIKKALMLYPNLKNIVKHADDPLLEAIKISIVGNAIDLGSTYETVEVKIENFMEDNFVLDSYESLKQYLSKAKKLLFIGDNAGETVFDRILIEELNELGKDVVYAVKSKPIINDATMEDAKLSKIYNIIETGTKLAGTLIYTVNSNFLDTLKKSDLILAKGQANYETLSDEQLPLFFLLKIKCHPISKSIGYPVGTHILLKSKNFKENY